MYLILMYLRKIYFISLQQGFTHRWISQLRFTKVVSTLLTFYTQKKRVGTRTSCPKITFQEFEGRMSVLFQYIILIYKFKCQNPEIKKLQTPKYFFFFLTMRCPLFPLSLNTPSFFIYPTKKPVLTLVDFWSYHLISSKANMRRKSIFNISW